MTAFLRWLGVPRTWQEWLASAALVFGLFVLLGCSPRAFQEVNKLAPEPPYAGERHGGMDLARYLRVEEPSDQ